MREKWSKLRISAIDSVSILKDLLNDNAIDDKPLFAAYLETKHVLANAFEALAMEKYDDSSVLKNAKISIENAMNYLYPHIPKKYLKVRGFGKAHARLLSYLTRHVENEISAAMLRILTGDAVHTERRARELRELGYQLNARHTGGTDVYVLCSPTPDSAIGARIQVAKNIREDKSIKPNEAELLLKQLE